MEPDETPTPTESNPMSQEGGAHNERLPSPDVEAVLVVLSGVRSLSNAVLRGFKGSTYSGTVVYQLTFSGLVGIFPIVARMVTLVPTLSRESPTFSSDDLETIGAAVRDMAADVLEAAGVVNRGGDSMAGRMNAVLSVLSVCETMAVGTGTMVRNGTVDVANIPTLVSIWLSLGPSLANLQLEAGEEISPSVLRSIGYVAARMAVNVVRAFRPAV